MANAPIGLRPLSGINIIKDDAAFATAEERSGGTVNPFHSHTGEIAKPYSWQSLQTPGASHGPYGPENQLLDDEFWFLEPAGMPQQDPDYDLNMPSLSRSHGSVNNKVTNYGRVPSQDESIDLQVAQMNNKASDLNTSNTMMYNSLGYVQQDDWREIWEINPGNMDAPMNVKQFSHSSGGFGVNDALMNLSRKVNAFGYGSKHMHRRYAQGHLPGNFMWLQPRGRILYKTIAGTARLPIGPESQFSAVDEPGNAKDIGFPFDPYGAVLQNTPTEYIPPPSPNIEPVTPAYTNDQGTDGFDLW